LLGLYPTFQWPFPQWQKGKIKRDAGRSINHVCQDFPGEWTPGIFLTKDIDALLDANDGTLPEEAADFISGAFVPLQAVKKGLVVKLFPLLRGITSKEFFTF
jgi:hypothetical protein